MSDFRESAEEELADVITASGADLIPADGRKGRPRKNLFGRPDLAKVYRGARDLIVKHRVFLMAQSSVDEAGTSSVVICNLWRIDRSIDGEISCFDFDLATEAWEPTTSFEWWPSVPFYPIKTTRSLKWWRDVVRGAIWKALIAAGYYTLTPPEAKQMSGRTMAKIMIEHYLGRSNEQDQSGESKGKGGFLKSTVMVAGARALRAKLFDHVFDEALCKTLLAIAFGSWTLTEYLRFAMHRKAVLRVADERRNLLPLLLRIEDGYWERTDLFSRKVWVRDGRNRTLVDYKRFSAGGKVRHFSSFDSRAAWRWFGKAQLTVVRAWGLGNRDVNVIENLCRANITVKIPAVAWCEMVSGGSGYQFRRLGVGEAPQRVYRAFAKHCAAMWRNVGFKALQAWLERERGAFADIADWLIDEGMRLGFPDKHATWEWLRNRCADWHLRVEEENRLRRQDYENQTWDVLIGQTVIDGVSFTPLDSVRSLFLEGQQQHHCVGNYAAYCIRGQYRVFSVEEADGTRSTLGLDLNAEGAWSVDQHRGVCNGPVSKKAQRAGRELAVRYQQAAIDSVLPQAA